MDGVEPTPTSKICRLCQSIPFTNIPAAKPGHRRIIDFGKLHSNPPLNFWAGLPSDNPSCENGYGFYENVSDLAGSARSCDLCRIIHNEVTNNLRVYDECARTKWYSDRFQQPHALDGGLEVVERIDKGSGFAVIAWMKDRQPPTCVVLANVNAFVAYDSALLPTIPGRPTGKYNVCNESLDWISGCIETCLAGHTNCSSLVGRLPKRVLDLAETTSEGLVRLIEPVDESDRYAALSYCWGKGNSFTLTTKNLSQLKTGVKPCSLPKTLRDAVQITQRLGLRYLWIDALCIAQDDRDDWAEQSAQMADIYGQAHITLAAQDTADVDEGCIFPLPVKFNDQVVLFPEASNEAVTCFITDAKDFMPRNLSLTVLNSRGWTFQERVLSRRVLFLRKTEIMFECNDMFVTQHGHQDAEKATISLNTAEPATDPGVSTVSSQTKAWNALVKEYSGRALSHMTDRLPALAGVASQFSKGTGADYIAGSWSNTVIENMLFAWAGGGDFGPEEEFYKTYTTPSWSWAAHYGRQGLVYEHIGDRIAEIIDMQASLSTGNPFGAISDSWLAVRAPLLSLSQTPNPDRPDASTGKPMCFKVAVDYPILVQDARVDLRFHWRTNPSANHLTVKLFALVLCWRDNVSAVRGQNDISSTDQIVSGIIVTPAGPQRAEMHRVGMLNLWGTGLRIWDRLTDSTTFSTVVLV